MKTPTRLLVVIVAVAACGRPAFAQDARLVWPPAPAAPRIRFVRTIDPRSVRGRPSFLARVARVITGGTADPQMLQPYGVTVGSDHRIYVADAQARAVHVFDTEKPGYSTIHLDADSLIGVAQAGLRLFVTDSGTGRVIALDMKGKTIWSLGPREGFQRPTGIVAADAMLFVVDTGRHRVVRVTVDGAIVGAFGERGGAPGQFNFPTNIARGADGRIYVTDTLNFRVQIFDRDGHVERVFGHLGDGSGDFDKPKGVAVDDDGRIFVVESFNDIVQLFDPAGRLLMAFGESGTGEGQLWLPSGIAVDRGVVYVADSANRRIQMFEYLREVP